MGPQQADTDAPKRFQRDHSRAEVGGASLCSPRAAIKPALSQDQCLFVSDWPPTTPLKQGLFFLV